MLDHFVDSRYYRLKIPSYNTTRVFIHLSCIGGCSPWKSCKTGHHLTYVISLTSCSTIVIRNRKIIWKHWPYCWYSRLNLKYLRWPCRTYIETAKNGDFCEELLSENDFETVLATFCCYDHGAKASEAVQKIATDQKEYRKCSLCVIICWIAKIYLSINNSEKWLVTGIPLT